MTQERRPISRLSFMGVLVALVCVAACSQAQHPTAPSAASAGQAQASPDASPFFGAMSLPSFGSQVDWSTFAIAAGAEPLVIVADQPNPPGNLAFTVTGSTVVLTWSPGAPGGIVDAYILEAGAGSGLSNIARFNTGSTATTLTVTDVPAFTYYVRVRAANGSSASDPSNEITVIVGGTPPPPPPGPTRWVGVAPDGMIVQLDPQDQCPAEYDLDLQLTTSGTTVTGTATTRIRRVEAAGPCGNALGQVSTWPVVNGSVGSSTISFNLGNTGIHRFSGTFTAARMTGTFVTTQTVPRLTTQTGSFVVNRQ